MTSSIDHACLVDGHRRGIVHGVCVPSWGRIESLKTFGSLGRETLIKIKILIGIARSVYLEPHLVILHRAL